MRSDSSRTTTAAAATASASPSRVMTLPRRNSSQSTWPSSARRIWSLEPLRAAGDLVGELELAAHQPRSASWASAETRLPSARPATRAIDAFMTWPMSLGELAPVSATASATIARSSSSESSAGR